MEKGVLRGEVPQSGRRVAGCGADSATQSRRPVGSDPRDGTGGTGIWPEYATIRGIMIIARRGLVPTARLHH